MGRIFPAEYTLPPQLPHGRNPLRGVVTGNAAVTDPVQDQFAGEQKFFRVFIHAPIIKFYEVPEIGFFFEVAGGAVVQKVGDSLSKRA